MSKGQEFCFAFRSDYRQEGEMSSDDNEESMQIKKIECDRVHEIQKDWGAQLRVKEPFGEDAPFFFPIMICHPDQICFLERQMR